jgi:acetate kinase
MNVLVLNAGSSTLKFQVIGTDLEAISQNRDQRLKQGFVDVEGSSIHDAVGNMLDELSIDIHAVGHRVVHGGERFSESALITDEVLEEIRACIELAPLHNPKNIEGIEAVQKFFGPQTPQVAVFDTAFHHRIPKHAFLYAIPYRFYEQYQIRRYGFHGTSHRYVAHRYRVLRHVTREETNIISLHLGNGCSAAAIQAGYPIDTSMGMTPLEGLVMGTRSGDLDPSLVTFIGERENLSPEKVETLLNNECGLLGISGVSNDMRQLQQSGNEQARVAIDMFCYRARKYIGAYLAAMGRTDAIVFTGGIGEHASQVREQICRGLEWAGLTIDAQRNAELIGKEGQITTDASRLPSYCIPTDEELLIARDTVRCILGVPHPS